MSEGRKPARMCAEVGSIPAELVVSGSTTAECAECKCLVWVDPRQKFEHPETGELIDSATIVNLCMSCCLEIMMRSGQ